MNIMLAMEFTQPRTSTTITQELNSIIGTLAYGSKYCDCNHYILLPNSRILIFGVASSASERERDNTRLVYL